MQESKGTTVRVLITYGICNVETSLPCFNFKSAFSISNPLRMKIATEKKLFALQFLNRGRPLKAHIFK